MRFKTKLALLFLLGTLITFSQSDDAKLPQVIPVSPNTASLGKYGEIPIGHFTGSPQINIPLCELKTTNLLVPVTLRYSSNGVRVDEYSSNVGMGWDLSAGGVITRQINDDPDENPQAVMPNIDTDLYTQPMLDFLMSQTDENGNGHPNSGDYQPDIYSFSFNGFSGSFYLDKNSSYIQQRTPILLEPAPLKIEVLGGGGELSGFVITDPNGIKYTFDVIEESMSRSSCFQLPTNLNGYRTPKAWHLAKISHPNGDNITFIYDLITSSYANGVSQNITVQAANNSGNCNLSTLGEKKCLFTSTSITPYLKEINSSKVGRITFAYSSKLELPEQTKMNKLDSIKVYDNNGLELKTQLFEYEIYDSNGHGNSLLSNTQSLNEDYHSKRVFLKKVVEKSKTGSLKPPHVFEYHDPDGLPTRFAGSQDYWGYYNGKPNINLIDTKTMESVNGSGLFANQLNTFVAADRNPRFYHGMKGILSKVTYPAKGYNKLYYEPHSYAGTTTILPAITTGKATVHNNEDPLVTDEFTTLAVTFDHEADLHPIIDLNELEEDYGGSGPTADPLTFAIEVKDAATNQYITIYERVGSFNYSRGNPFTVTKDNFGKDYFIRLEAGKTYKVKVSVSRHHTKGTVKLHYYTSDPTIASTNIEVGGLRIAKVETYDDNGNVQTKNYHYGTLDDLALSSGRVVNRNSDPTITFSETRGGVGGTDICYMATLSANSAFSIYGVYHIGYNSVIEEYGNDFAGGGNQMLFQTSYTGLVPNLSHGDFIPGTPLGNIFGFGRDLGNKTFKKAENSFITLHRSKNYYKHDTLLDEEIQAYNVREMAKNIGTYQVVNIYSEVDRYEITGYKKKRQWHYLEKSIDSLFDQDGLNPLVTTKEYFYDNPNHLQITRTKTTIGDDDPILTKTFYPDDVTSTSSMGFDHLSSTEKAAIDKLKPPTSSHLTRKHRVVEPIQVSSYLDRNNNDVMDATELLSVQRTNYKNNGNPLPNDIQTLKGEYDGSTNKLQERLTFHSYYSNGNIREVSKKDGAKIVYIWGYNNQYPIAKIENATYAQVEGLPYFGNNFTITNGLSTNQENSLRNNLAYSMITTYTYNPQIGITSMTDPGGYTTYYTYDDFNRLKYIKNKDGDIVEQYNYNYKYKEIVADISSSASTVNSGQNVTISIGNLEGGSGSFTYNWTISNANLNQTSSSSNGSLSITTSTNHAPNFTITCEILDNITKETLVKTIQVNVTTYSMLSVSSISNISGSNANTVGNTATFKINVSGGSGNYHYAWKRINSQSTSNFSNNTNTLSYRVVSSDCSRYTIYCTVTDLTTNETSIKSLRVLVDDGCSGGGGGPTPGN